MEKKLMTVPMADIKPYENNPRRNDDAVEAVKESIRQCEYISPIIVDENMVILAGHTRAKALEEMSVDEVEVMQVTGLSEQQKKKYRLLDNKTAEIAGWDFTMLDIELQDLDFEGYDFQFPDFGDQLDISDDDFISDTEITKSKQKTVTCPNCGEEIEV